MVRLKWSAAHGKRMAACRRDTGAKPRRRREGLRASSTIGRERGLETLTRHSWRGRGRSGSSRSIVRRGIGQLVRKLPRTSIARTSGVYLARRSGGHEHHGRTRRSAARRVARGTAEALEVDLERLRLAHARPREKRAGGIVQPKAKINVSPVAHHYFRTRAAIRDSAEAQPASKGVPGLSMSMTSGA